MNELFERYQEKLNLIAQDEADGKINSKTAEFERDQLTEEYQQALAEFDAAEEDVAEFAAGNSLGATLLELGEETGYEDAEEYLIDLSDALGISPEDAYDLITSEEEPDEELVEDVLDTLFPDDEEEFDDDEEEFDEDEVEDEYEDETEYDDEEEFDEDLIEDELEEEVSYSASRIDELEEEMAEFKLQQDLKYGLSQLRNQALDLLENGSITSFGYSLLFPDVESDDDLVACFGAMVEKNESDIATQLSNIQAVINWASKTFPEGIFNDYIQQEEQAAFSQQDYDPVEDESIKATANYFLQNMI